MRNLNKAFYAAIGKNDIILFTIDGPIVADTEVEVQKTLDRNNDMFQNRTDVKIEKVKLIRTY